MTLLARWRRMERRDAIGYSLGLAGVVILVFAYYFAWSWIAVAVFVVIAILLIAAGVLISPPGHWRWGKYPVAVKDPAHEHYIGRRPDPAETEPPVAAKGKS